MNRERRRSILIAGARGAGTSVYAVSLVHWQQAEKERARLCLLPADGDAARWVNTRVSVHRDGVAVAPRLTTSARPHRFRLYQLDAPSAQTSRSTAVVGDVSCWSGAINLGSDAGEPGVARDLLAEVARAHALVLLVPALPPVADANGGVARSWLRRVLKQMRDVVAQAHDCGAREVPFDPSTNTLTCPVALCVSQIDHAPDAERREARSWVESVIGERAAMLDEFLSRHMPFKLTSMGRTPQPSQRGAFIQGRPEPRGILAPLHWVLEQTGVRQ